MVRAEVGGHGRGSREEGSENEKEEGRGAVG